MQTGLCPACRTAGLECPQQSPREEERERRKRERGGEIKADIKWAEEVQRRTNVGGAEVQEGMQ